MILFLSKYPETDEDRRDGLFQRVMHIDGLFQEREKVYLYTSPYRFFTKQQLRNDEDKRVILNYNWFLHFFQIIALFRRSKLIYIHSIHNLLYSFMFLQMFRTRCILDLHGLVPEEFVMEGDRTRAVIFSGVERWVYPRLDYVVAVTERMAKHYRQKYPAASARYIIYPILSRNLQKMAEEEIVEAEREARAVFIYSGNLQAWQNIDMMLDTIRPLSTRADVFIQILTGETEAMRKRFAEKNISMKNVDIRGVESHELAAYYKKAHYGFVLRDDIPVNNVACPTKLIEYMNYGIVPIVLSDEIGDFKNMGFERMNVAELDMVVYPQKSRKNISIIAGLYNKSAEAERLLKGLYV